MPEPRNPWLGVFFMICGQTALQLVCGELFRFGFLLQFAVGVTAGWLFLRWWEAPWRAWQRARDRRALLRAILARHDAAVAAAAEVTPRPTERNVQRLSSTISPVDLPKWFKRNRNAEETSPPSPPAPPELPAPQLTLIAPPGWTVTQAETYRILPPQAARQFSETQAQMAFDVREEHEYAECPELRQFHDIRWANTFRWLRALPSLAEITSVTLERYADSERPILVLK